MSESITLKCQMRSERFALALMLCLLCWPIASSADTREQVLVGLYHFPPFIVKENDTLSGVAIDLLQAMNEAQIEFRFTPIAISPVTRHQILELGRIDMSMFEQPEWGWKGRNVYMSDVIHDGAEVYIALALPGRSQSYFDQLKGKRMIGVRGYHYSFAGFNSDPAYLEQNYKMQLTPSNLGSIQMVLRGNRGDIAVVTRSFLAQYLAMHPDDRDRILVSEKLDQRYQLRIALRKGLRLSIERLNQLLAKLKDRGIIDRLWMPIDQGL